MPSPTTHASHLRKLKKVLGAVLLVYGIFALLTPFTPGAFLALLGAEYLGIRLLFWERLKARLSQPPWPVITIVASVLVSLVTAGIFFTVLKHQRSGGLAARPAVTRPVSPPPVKPSPPAPTPGNCPPPAPTPRAPTVGCLMVGGNLVRIEYARTPAEQARGLSQRDRLDADAGMYFVFPDQDTRAFWMTDTRIPLDLIWVRDGRVIGATENVRPEPGVADDRLRRYPSPGPVDAVLEMNAGWAAARGVAAGDTVSPVFRERY